MKVELIYNLRPGVSAAEVNLSQDDEIIARHKQKNPDSKTALQVYSNWFNLKVVLVQTDGTKVVKDYTTPDLLNYFTTKYNWKGTLKSEGSSFIFQYSRKFGELHIKVVDVSPDERPVLIVRGHRPKVNGNTPRVFDLNLRESVKLPFTNGQVDDFFENSTGTYGTTVHFLDLNEEAVPHQMQWLEQENLKALEAKLAGVMSYKKHAFTQRGDGYDKSFQEKGAPLEVEALNQRDCETTLLEIVEKGHYPERVNAFVTTALIGRLESILKKKIDPKVLNSFDRASAISAIHSKVYKIEHPSASPESVNSDNLEIGDDALPEPNPPIKAAALIAEEAYIECSPEPVAVNSLPNFEIIEGELLADTSTLIISSGAAEFNEVSEFPEEELNIEDLLRPDREESELEDELGPFEEETSTEDLLRSLDVGFDPDDLLDELDGPNSPKRARIMGEY